MKMVVENDPRMDFEAFVDATIVERLDQNIATLRSCEDWEPCHDGSRDKVSRSGFVDLITATHRDEYLEAKLRGQVRSQVQLGNEGKR